MVYILGLLSIVVTLALLWPLLKQATQGQAKPLVPSSNRSVRIAEYKRRLADLDRDVDRGLIAPEDAQIAKAEIARALLAVEGDRTDKEGQQNAQEDSIGRTTKIVRLATIGGIAGIPVMAFLIYFSLGNPTYQDQPLAKRQRAGINQKVLPNAPLDASADTPVNTDINTLIAQLETRLAANPDEAQGWAVLARTYDSLQRSEDAARAWERLLALEPDNADALWFSGVHAAQSDRKDEAKKYWVKLQEQFNPGSEDYQLLEQALATLEAQENEGG